MSESFDCSLTRETLWPDPTATTETETADRAKNHLALCAACQAFFSNDHELVHRLSALSNLRAPDALRERISSIMVRESTPDTRPIPLFRPRIAAPLTILAMAAALVLLVARSNDPQPPRVLTAVAAGHIWENSTQRTEETSPPKLIEWFEQNFEHKMSVPDIPGGEVLGATIAIFEGHRAASVSYDVKGTRVAYMVVPTSFVMNRSISAGDGPYYITREGENENAVLWGWDETARILTGALPPEDLLRIAERCRHAEQNAI